ncbi:MAG: nickel pincer cofactor biosynthesis protein LarC [Firmicutes bacterium]|nr:nickel pincer cofactor biosynthesis protein LarC [Bacillota bacterium]
MRIAYLDCHAGISGNMFLGALIDLGYPIETLKTELGKLALPIPELQIQKVSKKGISATWFDLPVAHEDQHRNLAQICELILRAGYSSSITDNAIGCFRYLAEAEAKIHGVSLNEVHFHEVGAVDAIIDIIGACLGIEYFEIEELFASPVRVGFGSVKCAHGEIPVPAPATFELLSNFDIYIGEYEGEWTTPTGAAILKYFAKSHKTMANFLLEKIGYGAGTTERAIANVHRIVLGNLVEVDQKDYQVILETNIDDLNPEMYGFLGEELLKQGARDYYFTPIYMKKGRPGILVTVIVSPEYVQRIEDLLFRETTTLGIRKKLVERDCLIRDYRTINLKGYKIQIKVALRNGAILKFAPEYNDCLLAAKNLKQSLKQIYEEAEFQYRKILYDEGSC